LLKVVAIGEFVVAQEATVVPKFLDDAIAGHIRLRNPLSWQRFFALQFAIADISMVYSPAGPVVLQNSLKLRGELEAIDSLARGLK
jgi:hypothetical protein